jgi:hypothetical protein
MKIGFILSVLLVVCAAGGGFWFGQHHAPATATTPGNPGAADASKLPGFMKQPAAATTDNAANPVAGKMTLADIEAKILELQKQGVLGTDFSRQQSWVKMMAEVELADIPALLAFVDKNISHQTRWGLR